MADDAKNDGEQGAAAATQAQGATTGGEGSAASSVSESKLGQALHDEIESSVESVMKDIENSRAAAKDEKAKVEGVAGGDGEKKKDDDLKAEGDDSQDDKEDGEGDKGGKAPEGDDAKKDGKADDKGQAGEAPAITDDQLTRAVKAGMSLGEARTFRDGKALDRVCELLEQKAEKDGANKGDDKNGKNEEEDPLAGVPDLEPEEYDEKLVSGFKTMKDIIRKQHGLIKDMVSRESKPDQSWIDDRIATLGDAYAESLGKGSTSKLDPNSPQAKKRAELNEKMNVLIAGYKAAGKDVDRGAVFGEAVSVVLRDVVQKAAEDAKAAELAKRSKQHTVRPGANKTAPTGDVLADVANAVDRKFFGKTG
jgi:hypothetical protein